MWERGEAGREADKKLPESSPCLSSLGANKRVSRDKVATKDPVELVRRCGSPEGLNPTTLPRATRFADAFSTSVKSGGLVAEF